nr:MAG TPA: TREPONEMA DENTICOLA VARIABLE PROTEIN 1 FUNCTION, PERIODONTAL DISEASE [Caudoviricetes sp.]
MFTDSGLTSFPTTGQWVKKINNNAAADLFCQEGGGSSTTYFCDHYWTNADDSNRTLLLGACTGYGSAAGLFSLASNNGLGGAAAHVGTRLVYIP